MTRLVIRGFIGRAKQFEERIEVSESGDEIGRLAERHATRLLALPGGTKHMIEFEFPDEPDPARRYFRFGTDATGMIRPVSIRLEGRDSL